MLNENQWVRQPSIYADRERFNEFCRRQYRWESRWIYPKVEEWEWGAAAVTPDGVGVAAWVKPEVIKRRKETEKRGEQNNYDEQD